MKDVEMKIDYCEDNSLSLLLMMIRMKRKRTKKMKDVEMKIDYCEDNSLSPIEVMIEEMKKTHAIIVDMAKDIKDMKTFLHSLTNKLNGII